jgi:hypothetical protein
MGRIAGSYSKRMFNIKNRQNVSQSNCIIFHFPSAMYENSSCLQYLSIFGMGKFFHFRLYDGYILIPHCSLNLYICKNDRTSFEH